MGVMSNVIITLSKHDLNQIFRLYVLYKNIMNTKDIKKI